MIGPRVHYLDADATASVFRKMGRRIREQAEREREMLVTYRSGCVLTVQDRPLAWWERALAWLDQVWL
jgi:hypothetical protein